jgi:predicted transposase YbfD/YdcC
MLPTLVPKGHILHYFSALVDKRMRQKVTYDLAEVIALAICAVIGGADSWEEIEMFGHAKIDWFKGFLALENGVPSDQTFSRIFSTLDSTLFQKSILSWFDDLATRSEEKLIAIDGKSLRRSIDSTIGRSPLHLVSAWSSEQSIVLGQVKVDDKSNEITAVPRLLRMIDVMGGLVTIDAMGCQKEIAKDIIDGGGDYVLALKGNQSSLHDQIVQYFDGADSSALSKRCGPCVETVEKGHGRMEVRAYWQTTDIDWIQGKQLWKGFKSIGIARSQRTVGAKTSSETRYFITSLGEDLQRLSKAVRNHWSIESTLHWTLDMSFGEDYSRIRRDHSGENFALMRRTALSILKHTKDKKARSIKGRRAKAGWDNTFLTAVLINGLREEAMAH